jgi:hypothetical protein
MTRGIVGAEKRGNEQKEVIMFAPKLVLVAAAVIGFDGHVYADEFKAAIGRESNSRCHRNACLTETPVRMNIKMPLGLLAIYGLSKCMKYVHY